MNFTEVEREVYEDQLKWLRIKTNSLKKAEEKGLEKGKIKGITERNIEIAKQMLKDNVPLDSISSYTDLSINEIKALMVRDN